MPRSREQNAQIREESKRKMLEKSALFFAERGLQGTKIGDLAKYVGMAQGSLYTYFNSKEKMYDEIIDFSCEKNGTDEIRKISEMDIPPIRKLRYISDYILKNMASEKMYCAYMMLSLEKRNDALLSILMDIVKTGQKEGSFAKGNVEKIADYYLSVVYIYCKKKLHDPSISLITSEELERVVRG